MSKEQEINERVKNLPLEQRNMLAEAIDVLSLCCGEHGGQALVVFVPPDSDIAQLFVFNSDEAAAYDMSDFARSHMESLMLKDMPPKERLN
tara:strand:+ start:581 stop:853 length:273 start_codon:yes stop_codon:yes gene_type:complete